MLFRSRTTCTHGRIFDLDKASLDLHDFIQNIAFNIADHAGDYKSPEMKALTLSSTLTPTLLGFLEVGREAQIADFYHRLVAQWIKPLPSKIHDRVRVALERSLRGLAAQMCLASYAVRFDSDIVNDSDETPRKNPTTGQQFVLPVRRRLSFNKVQKQKAREVRSSSPPETSQVSADAGFLASSPLRALPTPMPTPSLRSRSSMSSLPEDAEDLASIDLQYFTSLAPQPPLPAELSHGLLGHWVLGADPADYDFETAQQAMTSHDEEGDSLGNAKKKEREDRSRKRQGEVMLGRPSPKSPKKAGFSYSQQMYVGTPGDSGPTGTLVTASQIEPGRHGGRPKKAKKKRLGGF